MSAPPLVHFRHPADDSPVCGATTWRHVHTTLPDVVTCEACQELLTLFGAMARIRELEAQLDDWKRTASIIEAERDEAVALLRAIEDYWPVNERVEAFFARFGEAGYVDPVRNRLLGLIPMGGEDTEP